MKIWIDIICPPDVFLFKNIWKSLSNEGHEVFITGRTYQETPSLLKCASMPHTIVGSHGGNTLGEKLSIRLERTLELTNMFKDDPPDVIVSRHSAPASQVGFGLGKPVVYLIDDIHAKAQSKLGLPLSDRVIAPSVTDMGELISCGADPKGIRLFDGIFEYVYLKKFDPNSKVLDDLGLENEDEIVVIRTEPQSSYMLSNSVLFPTIDKLIDLDNIKLVVLPRYLEQRSVIEKEFGNRVIMPEGAIDAPSLLAFTNLLIGAGGTMNREAALLGTPVINCYSGPIPVSDDFIIKKGLAFKLYDPDEIVKKSIELLETKKDFEKLSKKVKRTMEDPTDLIISSIKDFE